MPAVVTYELRSNVALIGLNRPEKRNAMSLQLFQELAEAAERAADEAMVGVLFGHGDQFSAGLDLADALQWMQKSDPLVTRRRPNFSRLALARIGRGPIPFVAALHGAVIGAGFELAATAHVRVADESSYYALPEAKHGIFLGGGGATRIQRLIGYGPMADMMLTGRVYDAGQGERIGAAQYLVPKGNALDKAIEIALAIAKNAPLSNWAVTNALPRIGDLPEDEGLFFETMAGHFVVHQESEERLTSFLEKRSDRLVVPKS